MKKNDKIEKEIEKTLGLFEEKESLPPNPFFYTRVKHRIEEKSSRKLTPSNIFKPVFFALLLILNFTTVIWYSSLEETTDYSESEMELVDVLKSNLNLESDLSENLIFERVK